MFAADEESCAAELIELALKDVARAGDYRLLVAEPEGRSRSGRPLTRPAALAGYICYGPTPMTQGTWDLYWLATAPEFQRQGIARSLCTAMEDEIRGLGGYLVRVETSSTEGYGSAQSFYERSGYPMHCRVADFYKPGDDLVLMFKRL